MLLKILFLSEDTGEHLLLESMLKKHFFNIKFFGFQNRIGLLKHLAFDSSFRLMIIECRSHEYNPVDVSCEVLKFVGQRNFLFVGQREVLDKSVRDRLDLIKFHYGIYEKPFTQTGIFDAVQNVLSDNEEEVRNPIVKVDRKKYFPIGIKNFYLFSKVPYDAFIELSKDRFVKILSKNDPYSEHTIKKIVARNVRRLFIEKTSYIQFLEESMESAGSLMYQKEISPVKVFEVQISSVMLIHQYVKNIGVSDAVIRLVGKVIDATVKNIESFDHFKDVLQMFPFEQRDVAEKSVLILYVCEMIVKSLQWNSEITHKQLGLAAIVHDCFIESEELFHMGEITSEEYNNLPEEMKKEFLEHPTKAATLASQFVGFSNVEFLVEEHHELPNGKGFPGKKKVNKISGVSCTFIMAVNFVNQLAIHGISRGSMGKVISDLEKKYNIGFCKKIIKTLESCVGMEP